ncbi:MFS transporter [Curtobacterium sp. MCJR17_055]|uniref:MFS transporter n=1 Tax=unclassified Curtobacterium TaxID=257496 RepID=UPI000D83DC1B|nr:MULTISPECIES: MFS transporter [unclassified Curtobacterium]PYY33269.1 MFS transporter [Curtobacterium sp. MCBD17_029]PYY47491.1 MFS transporter [Curtobacterium sp. MCBD17_023]PYY53212.1 MFS transporter [Curtobacterium sp. MCJR17_055]PYY56367.1 MFS transporter [Curtobacterium sp. MCPF17_015]PZE90091.1 MFS transporter [Curtobacterium sp. MCBD17_008]
MSAYGSLLKTPGVGRVIAAQLTARFPFGMLSLAYLLHVEHIFHSYGAAGLVLATTSVGQALAGPLTSRWMGSWGMRPVLVLTSIVAFVTMGVIAFFVMPLWAYVVIGFVGGLAVPPVQPAVRTIYPKMVTSKQLTPLFSLDASAQELIWVAGPVITTFVATQIGTVEAIVVAMAFLLVGGAWFIASPELGRVRIPRSKRAFGVVMKRPSVVVATLTGLLLIGACAAVEASVTSVFGEGSPNAGIVLAVFAIGSLIGGLALGHRPISKNTLWLRMTIVFVGLVLAVGNPTFWWLCIALVIAGAGIAPALAVMFGSVSATVKFSDTAEAYGWMGTGQLIGAAGGSAVAGFLIDSNGPSGGLMVGAVMAAAGVVLPLAMRSWLPDLRGRDVSPIPDTEPVTIPS